MFDVFKDSVCKHCGKDFVAQQMLNRKFREYCSKPCQYQWRGSLEARFWRKVTKTDTCWLGNASLCSNGYAQISTGTRADMAHRVSWELHNGPIAGGLHVCHKCDVRHCVNPDHLFLGTRKDNAQDMLQKGRHASTRKTHCPAGHPYAPPHLYIAPRGDRMCRTCMTRRHLAKKRLTSRSVT